MSEIKDTKILLNGHEVQGWNEEGIVALSPEPAIGILYFQGKTADGRPLDHEWEITRAEAERIRDHITAELHGDGNTLPASPPESITVTIGLLEVPFTIPGAQKVLEYIVDLLEAHDRAKVVPPDKLPAKISGIATERALYVDGVELPIAPSLKLRNHSPTGFFWGYGGSGASQAALAISLLYLPEEQALAAYQDFKWDVIAQIPDLDFVLDGEDVRKWFEDYKERSAAE